MRLKLLTSLLIASALGACSAKPGPLRCPPLAEWSATESAVLADEIEEFAWQAPYLYRAAREYTILREQCRDYRSSK